MAAYFSRGTMCLQMTFVYDTQERTPLRVIRTIADVEMDEHGQLPAPDWLGTHVEVRYLPLPGPVQFIGYAGGKALHQWVEDGVCWREHVCSDGIIQGVPVRGAIAA